MQVNIAFYIHHHGSGHLMRALAIAKELSDARITFLGSGLLAYDSLIPDHINCIHLPLDVPVDTDIYYKDQEREGLHYAPLHVAGQRDRTAQITNFFHTHYPVLLVVDVSVEIAMLAGLSGIPAIVVRQHGYRNDLPHQLAYHNAIALLAPYAKGMAGTEPSWLSEKTFYAGGLSRFLAEQDQADPAQKQVAVILGSGGTSMDDHFIRKLATDCSSWTIHVLGNIRTAEHLPGNVVLHGHIDQPQTILKDCIVVIGNSGHNTVMEIAAMNKRFIAIPESRPFDEQLHKANILAEADLATVILPEELRSTNWSALLEKTVDKQADWSEMSDARAAAKAAAFLTQTFYSTFAANKV